MKPVRVIPPLTDAELDTRNSHPKLDGGGAIVAKDTLKRVDEALRWHEQRAKKRAS